jgi:hypothetical protein
MAKGAANSMAQEISMPDIIAGMVSTGLCLVSTLDNPTALTTHGAPACLVMQSVIHVLDGVLLPHDLPSLRGNEVFAGELGQPATGSHLSGPQTHRYLTLGVTVLILLIGWVCGGWH